MGMFLAQLILTGLYLSGVSLQAKHVENPTSFVLIGDSTTNNESVSFSCVNDVSFEKFLAP